MHDDDKASEQSSFQSVAGQVTWQVHFRSPIEKVFQFLTESRYRAHYWAESAEEENGVIHYKFLNGVESRGRILAAHENKRFVVEYFDMTVSFDLTKCPANECDMKMTCVGVEDHEKTELIAGWVSWLLTMKAAVDHGVDLRNHDEGRTWYQGFADN